MNPEELNALDDYGLRALLEAIAAEFERRAQNEMG